MVLQHRFYVGVEEAQFGERVVVCTPPDELEGSESIFCTGYHDFNVFISIS